MTPSTEFGSVEELARLKEASRSHQPRVVAKGLSEAEALVVALEIISSAK